MRGYVYKLIIIVMLVFGYINILSAAPDVFVSTDLNTGLIINVTVPETADTITADNSAQGVAIGVGGTAANPQFSYSPPNNYNGADTFVYHVLNGGLEVATATVTIQVGPLSSAAQTVIGTPEQVMLQQITDMCSSNGGQAPPSLTAFCSDFSIASPEERARILRETSPLELGGQNQLSAIQSNQQIDNVRRRMAVLRQGISGPGPLSDLRLNWEKKSYAVNDILDRSSGGAAAADGNEKLSAFVNGSFGGANHNSSVYEDGYSLSNRGITGGVDFRFNSQLIGGVALGSNRSSMDVDNSGGSVSSSGFSLLGYGSYYVTAQTYVEAIWALHKNSLDATRNMDYTVQGQAQHASAISSTDNAVTSLSLGTGYEKYFSKGITLTSSANLDWVKSGFDGYAESGASDKNLVVSKRSISQQTYSLNGKLTKAVSLPSGVLIPQLDFTWKHEFDGDAQTLEARYRADPTKTYFYLSTETPDTDYFQFNLGASYVVPGGNTGFIYYEKTLAKSGYSIYSLSLGLRMNIK